MRQNLTTRNFGCCPDTTDKRKAKTWTEVIKTLSISRSNRLSEHVSRYTWWRCYKAPPKPSTRHSTNTNLLRMSIFFCPAPPCTKPDRDTVQKKDNCLFFGGGGTGNQTDKFGTTIYSHYQFLSNAVFHWQIFATNRQKSVISIGPFKNPPMELTDFERLVAKICQ